MIRTDASTPPIIGRPLPPPIIADVDIARLRADGHGVTAIARWLNDNGVPTASGRGLWYPETVHRRLHRARHAAYMRDWRHGIRRRT